MLLQKQWAGGTSCSHGDGRGLSSLPLSFNRHHGPSAELAAVAAGSGCGSVSALCIAGHIEVAIDTILLPSSPNAAMHGLFLYASFERVKTFCNRFV